MIKLSVLSAVGVVLAATYGFWLLFLIYTAYKAQRDSGRPLPRAALVMIAPALLVGGLVDVGYNLLLGWALFVDWPTGGFQLRSPTSWTLTDRCDRHLRGGLARGADGVWRPDPGAKGLERWRGGLARALCANLLDPFQTGGHCHSESGSASPWFLAALGFAVVLVVLASIGARAEDAVLSPNVVRGEDWDRTDIVIRTAPDAVLTIAADGRIYWRDKLVTTDAELVDGLRAVVLGRPCK